MKALGVTLSGFLSHPVISQGMLASTLRKKVSRKTDKHLVCLLRNLYFLPFLPHLTPQNQLCPTLIFTKPAEVKQSVWVTQTSSASAACTPTAYGSVSPPEVQPGTFPARGCSWSTRTRHSPAPGPPETRGRWRSSRSARWWTSPQPHKWWSRPAAGRTCPAESCRSSCRRWWRTPRHSWAQQLLPEVQ